MITYRTAQIAALVGVHPNTVRFYETMGLLPPIPRSSSGYRRFDDRHLAQLRLLRTAFRAEIISDRLRQEVYAIVKRAAAGDLAMAGRDAERYLNHLREEKDRAEEAIQITLAILQPIAGLNEAVGEYASRNQVAADLGITADVLRDWERNGLIQVPRQTNGYRKYAGPEIRRLKIIRTLRHAHYSMMAILRMLNRLDQGESDIRTAIDTPDEQEDIVSAADRYITALSLAEQDACAMLAQLTGMLAAGAG